MAEIFGFFSAAFITTNICVSFALFEIAKNKQIQNIMQHEIDKVMTKHGHSWSHECLSEFKYVDQVIEETLRKYPTIPIVTRSNTKKYNLSENTESIIEKKTSFIISIAAIHHDPNYYPNPNEFDPERFSNEAKKKRLPYTYLPYGLGPRNCLASKMGHMLVKIALITVLSKFSIELDDKNIQNIEYHLNCVLTPKIKHKLRIEKRNIFK